MRLQRTLVGLTFSIATFAQSSPLGPDVAGGKDIPWLSRFAGSQMIGFQNLEFDQGSFYLPQKENGRASATELDTEKPVVVEGKVTRFLYITPIGKTALEVHRNFELALRNAGLKAITSVDGTNASWDAGIHWSANFGKLTFQNPFAVDISPFDRHGRYLYGTLKRDGREVSVSVFTGDTSVFTHQEYKDETQQKPLCAVAIQIVEPQAMETGQVTVTADAIRKGLADEGKIALYGIYFDTGKAILKPESKPQLEQMAALLKQQPSLHVLIVGHTDNQGGIESNFALSQQRAQAVTTALASDHAVDMKRLIAKGVANFSPVASNATEEGRAKNRRVEMVVQ